MTTVTSNQNANAAASTPQGWMVLGFNTHAISPEALKVPVISITAQAAMLEAAAKTPGFQPVGALSVQELQDDVDRIRAHCEANGVTI